MDRIGLRAQGIAGAALVLFATPSAAQEPGWGYYGGDAGGQRFSPARQITVANVARLQQAWRFTTGDVASKGGAMRHASFENTPVLAGGRLYICSPFNEVSAVDPGSGKPYWRFDPRIDPTVRYPNNNTCRGVAYWRNPQAPARSPCAERVFMNTNDRRLFALDAATGRPCAGFGRNGMVDAVPDAQLSRSGEVQITSPPVTAGGVVITGSSIDDNQKVKESSGAVHAFDAVTGAPRWRFDPLDGAGPDVVAGAANVWAPMSVDEARGLVFLPTTSPSPDFYGATRPGNGGHADSVVALHAADGSLAWAFQVTHHDVWDYDLPAQPTLAEVNYHGRAAPAVLQTTKQGLLFTLARETGAPVIPVTEHRVPQDGAPERSSRLPSRFRWRPVRSRPAGSNRTTPTV